MGRYSLCILALLVFPVLGFAQTGLPPFGSFSKGQFDVINDSYLNAIFAIPIISSPGRRLNLDFSAVYNSQVWAPEVNGAGALAWTQVAGWLLTSPTGQILNQVTTTYGQCGRLGSGYTQTTIINGYRYIDPLGTIHPFNISVREVYSSCTGNTTYSGTYAGYATDNSGYYASIANPANSTIPTITSKSGVVISTSLMTITDPNGNVISGIYVTPPPGSTETVWTDTAGRTALKIISGSTSIQYQFLDPTGNYQTTTVNLTSLNIKTNFGCSNTMEYSGTNSLPTSLVLPNGQTYQFSYEPTPGNTGYYTGRVQRVTLPTGGYYEYDYIGSNDGTVCADGSTLGLNEVVSDGINAATWKYSRLGGVTTITTPQLADTPNANDTVITFNSSGQETQRKIYKESPGVNALRTINTTWATNGTPATKVTILEDGTTQSEVATVYDSNGLLDSLSEYNWGSSTPFRTTTYTYQTSTNYTNLNIIGLVISEQIKDGSGTVQYRQDVGYDATSGDNQNCPTGAPQHNDAGFGCSFYYRGNPTSITKYLTPGTPANGITKNFTYDFFGNLLSAQLNCCQTKTWSYSSATQYSQPDSVTSGSSPTLMTSFVYNTYTGQVTRATDPNNLATNSSYDNLRRPISISQSIGSTNGESVSYSYDDTHFSTTTTASVDSSKAVKLITSLDGLGRPSFSATEDANSNVYSKVSVQNDLAGRAYQVSNPYPGTNASYWTTTGFDVLGRATSVTQADNSVTSNSYTTNTTTVTDPTGKKRESAADAAGRLSTIWEPDPSNANSLTLQTSYAYNVLDELTQISQGSQTRSYLYDPLGRLTSATTPESGAVCYGTVSGGICQSNGYDSFDNLLTRTDARGVVISYSYDGLNRLQGLSYNVSGATGVPATPSVSFTYGANASSYNNGRLITITDGVGSESYTYNNLSQLIQLQKVINGLTYQLSYAYNLAGEVTQITYPSGRVVQQSVDAIGRLCEVAPSTSGCGTASSPYATGLSYNTASELTGFKYGNGIYASFGFSADRLQLNCLDYSLTNRGGTCTHDSTTQFGLNYSYGSAGNNNGQILGITDSVDNGRSQTYTYDALYRLATAVTTGSSNYPQWGLSMTYDRYGNRTAQSIYSGCVAPMTCPTNSVAVSATTNHIGSSGYAYDASGNMTNDGSNTLAYDGENRLVTATNLGNSGTYSYDGNGVRVQKVSGGTTTVYIYSGSKPIAEYQNGALARDYAYFGGQRVALGSVDIRFTNDSCSGCGGNPVGGGDRNLFVNSITIGSTNIPPNDPSVSYVTPPCNEYANGVGQILCNGDMITASSAIASGQTITVNAYGSTDYNIYPHMQVLVNGSIVGEWDVTGTAQNYTVNAPSTAVQYYLPDHLGSTRISTDSAGNVIGQQGHFPYGESWYAQNATTKWQFTSYERDSESTNDYAFMRSFVNRLGSFSSPDPLSGTVHDTQSLNRYVYGLDDPCNVVDPLGLNTCTLNVKLASGNGVALSDADVTAITDRINSLLSSAQGSSADGVQVQTSYSGLTDYTLNFVNKSDAQLEIELGTGHLTLGDAPVGGAQGNVYPNAIRLASMARQTMSQQSLQGGVAAHELVHMSAQFKDEKYSILAVNTMMSDSAPTDVLNAAFADPDNALWKLTPGQLAAMYKDCTTRHKPTPKPGHGSTSSGGGGGGAGGGGGIGSFPGGGPIFGTSCGESGCYTTIIGVVWWGGWWGPRFIK